MTSVDVYVKNIIIIVTIINGPGTETFVKDLGSRLKRVSGDDEAYIHLMQRFSIVIQRGNCASVLGSTDVLNFTEAIPDSI